ncbi:MAG: 5-(carboxyamino)imidazole ribonucleotide synthase, partial [Actinomycetota bacterium]|nr:5-(carboxyamino)imidazole ribonucleotide synthase [Actinomycetota bacterium]
MALPTWPVVPPAAIGMLGGGQLGRYALIAAREMGYRTVVLDPDPLAPAGMVADVHLVAAYDDLDAIGQVAHRCSVATTEFENPPASTLERLARYIPVAPAPEAVAIAQDRRREKRFLRDAGLPVAPFAVIDTEEDIKDAAAAIDFPALLKTATGGYDGKGQATVAALADLAGAWQALGGVPCVLEQRLELDCEISSIIARSWSGDIAAYAVAENQHVDGILRVSMVPARVGVGVAEAAIHYANEIASRLEYVGVLAVELFVVDGQVVVNELAPRPHNSGHWTLDASMSDQFAQQVRAVCGLPLGSTSLTAPAAAMCNLLGDHWKN